MGLNEKHMKDIQRRLAYMDSHADPGSIKILTHGFVMVDDVYSAVLRKTDKELGAKIKSYLGGPGGAVLTTKTEDEKFIEVFLDGEFAKQREMGGGPKGFFAFVEYTVNGEKKGDLIKLDRPKFEIPSLRTFGLRIQEDL